MISISVKSFLFVTVENTGKCGAFVIPAEAGIQTASLRKQGTIQRKWVPVFTGNPGYRIKCGMTAKNNVKNC